MALSETVQAHLSGEDFFKMSDTERCELVWGRIVYMSPAGGNHGEIALEIGGLLRDHVKPRKIGKTYAAETGFYTHRNPDTIRAPDAMFISNERVAQIGDPTKFLDVVPELVVEVLSPNDTWTEVEAKIAEYLAVGVQLIWVIDPTPKTITIYRTHGERTRLTLKDLLTGDHVLPDFSVPVVQIFE